MRDNDLRETVLLCLEMDELAIGIYHNLAENTTLPDLKEFWLQMSREETAHVGCWRKLLHLVEEGAIPQIFPQGETVVRELTDHRNKIIAISEGGLQEISLKEQFLAAFRLEFYLLHPALEQLWHFYGIIQREEYNPESEYENHIRSFIVSMRQYGVKSVELELLGETLEKMWQQVKGMAREAHYDGLTNILNRRGLLDAMSTLGYLTKRNGFHSGLMMLDIDHFKKVNDNLGHQAGDLVLSRVAKIIKSSVRASDVTGRFGGEEFLVFLPQIEAEGLAPLAEKIRLAVESGTKEEIQTTVSIGVAGAVISGDVDNAMRQLTGLADEALYQAKSEGRNRVCLAPAPQTAG